MFRSSWRFGCGCAQPPLSLSTSALCPFFINGEWLRPTQLATSPAFNPSTGEVIGQVPLAGAAEVDAAVQAARAAFPA